MDQHFAKVREVKEAARREELRSHSAHHSSSNPTPEAGRSGVAFVQEWQKQQLCEGTPELCFSCIEPSQNLFILLMLFECHCSDI